MDAIDQVICKEKYEEFLELGNGSPSFLLQMLSAYLENFKKIIKACWAHYEENDRKSLEFEIHTLKGSSLNLGVSLIAKFLINIETKLSEISMEELKSSLEELESYVAIVEKYKKFIGNVAANT